jgi:hypothetical protein
MSGTLSIAPPPSTTLDLLLSASLPPLTCAASPASCPQGHTASCVRSNAISNAISIQNKLFRSSLCMAWIIHSRLIVWVNVWAPSWAPEAVQSSVLSVVTPWQSRGCRNRAAGGVPPPYQGRVRCTLLYIDELYGTCTLAVLVRCAIRQKYTSAGATKFGNSISQEARAEHVPACRRSVHTS